MQYSVLTDDTCGTTNDNCDAMNPCCPGFECKNIFIAKKCYSPEPAPAPPLTLTGFPGIPDNIPGMPDLPDFPGVPDLPFPKKCAKMAEEEICEHQGSGQPDGGDIPPASTRAEVKAK